jgi:alkylhydroperoxidase/carboxymuconolactone decarboxylase family protein YurZ
MSRKTATRTASLSRTNIVALATLAAAASRPDSDRLPSLLNKTLHLIPYSAIREAFLMVHLFAGFPASIEVFSELNKMKGIRKRKTKPVRMLNRTTPLAEGLALCKRVYGQKFEQLVRTLGVLDADLSRWILEYGYGRVLSRHGLSARDRELVAIAVLAATGWKRQFRSHVIGCKNLGADNALILRVVKNVCTEIGHRGSWSPIELANEALRAQKN